jgi:hypothetical protein
MTKRVTPEPADADAMSLMRLKLDRADARLNALHRQLDRWGKAHPILIGTELDRDSGWHTSYIRKAEPLPARLAIPVGESLYHGRSVLEHLVWALVKANKQTPGEAHSFPILRKPIPRIKRERLYRDSFVRTHGNGRLVGVHPDAMAVIERLQPYKRRKRPPYFLTILDEMAIEDRHHALHVARTTMADPRNLVDLGLRPPRGVVVIEWEPLFKAGDRLKPKTKLARFRLSRYGREPKVGVETDLPVNVAVGKRHFPFAVFHAINDDLRQLLRLFEDFL